MPIINQTLIVNIVRGMNHEDLKRLSIIINDVLNEQSDDFIDSIPEYNGDKLWTINFKNF